MAADFPAAPVDFTDDDVWEHRGDTVTTTSTARLACQLVGGGGKSTNAEIKKVIQGTKDEYTRTSGGKSVTVTRFNPYKDGNYLLLWSIA